MSRSRSSTYLHGVHPKEQARLSLLNGWLNPRSLGELNLRGGERILDVGSGLGQFARAMAKAAGTRVVAVERSRRQIAAARRQAAVAGESDLVEFRAGDALRLPLQPEEAGSFDLAHARFVLEHLRDPLAAVRQMVRAVRIGGRIVLADDDHGLMRLWPEPAGFGRLWQAYQRSYELQGNDPFVGRRLVSLLVEAGTVPVRNMLVFFGGCAGTPGFDSCATNLVGVIAGARTAILKTGLLGPAACDSALTALTGWRNRRDASVWYAVSWAEGRRDSPVAPGRHSPVKPDAA